MSEVLIPFAKQTTTGRIVSVDEVLRGNACECVCIFCDVPMQARKGGHKQEHFAHQPRLVEEANCCNPSFERSLFWMARRILRESSKMTLPSYTLSLADWHHDTHTEQRVTEGRHLHYDSVEFPANIKNPKHDVAIISVGYYQLAMTLDFGISSSRGAYLHQGQRIAHLVIEMGNLKSLFLQNKIAFRTLMESHLINSIVDKHWLYHPNEVSLLEAHKAVVDAAIAKEQSLREAQKKVQEDQWLEQRKVASLTPKVVPETTPPQQKTDQYTEATQQRLSQLIAIVESLKQDNFKTGYVCEDCKVMRPPESASCTYCDGNDYKEVQLSNSYLANLQQKYWCWNYAEKSLKTVSEPGFKSSSDHNEA